MTGYERIRDELQAGQLRFLHLDAAQLVKHAFGLRSELQREGPRKGKQAVLLYLYAEPAQWPSRQAISPEVHAKHRSEIAHFRQLVRLDEVAFKTCSYRQLLDQWRECSHEAVRVHADAVAERFKPY